MKSIFSPRLIRNPDGRLRTGCYLICYTPDEPDSDVIHYDGTLRVQRHTKDGKDSADSPNAAEFIMASGDLYAHTSDRPVTELSVGQGDSIPIPIFPRDEYRFYFCVKSIPVWSITPAGFDFVIESHSYERKNHPAYRWYSRGQFTAKMRWDLPPKGYPSDTLYAKGTVYEPGGIYNGTLTMAWISEHFRRAKLVIHQASGVDKDKVPKDWVEQFRNFGWFLQTELIENEGQFAQNGVSEEAPWSDAQLREVMERVRKSQQPDEEWRYDLLFVPEIIGRERGVTLYHTEDPTCGHVRELATVAAKYTFPTEEEEAQNGGLYKYGKAINGRTLESQEDLYRRTSMHELGHAMGLRHNANENGFMITTDELAHVDNQKIEKFPKNAKFGFSIGDLQRLRHWPDFLVRPGTDADGNILPSVVVPVFPDPGQDDDHAPPKREVSRDVCLHAMPLNETVPLGAPVRIVYRLVCLTESAYVPRKPGFKSGALTVRVSAPNGTVRTVSSMENDEGQALMKLVSSEETLSAPNLNNHILSAATLLRDDDGHSLFPEAGEYKVNLEISWWIADFGNGNGNGNGGVEYVVKAQTRVAITPVPDDRDAPDIESPIPHADAARLVFATPELQEVLVRHSALFPGANNALEQAMKCKILRPHFAYVDFRVRADRLPSDPANLERAFQVLLDAHKPGSKEPVLAPHEVIRTNKILEQVKDNNKRFIQGKSWPSEVREMLDEIRGDEYPLGDGNGDEQRRRTSVVGGVSSSGKRKGGKPAKTK